MPHCYRNIRLADGSLMREEIPMPDWEKPFMMDIVEFVHPPHHIAPIMRGEMLNVPSMRIMSVVVWPDGHIHRIWLLS
jgi:hypothetical protein